MEYLTQENDRLTSALVTSREEISRLSALVGGGSVVGMPLGVVGSHVGVNGGGGGGGGAVQPVSMNVALPAKQQQSVGGALSGYGY